ncbi:hypothetical protein ACPW96_18620 [Micromonospora sp. DT81.3]|uniref:hypothetical protein n=1 Tax=Micromonospora sp. DT81.3 TaxID=3416523 RepID=UPI003CFA9852
MRGTDRRSPASLSSCAAFDEATGRWRSGTFATGAERLPAIADMGFDVVYLTPIYPIGHNQPQRPAFDNEPVGLHQALRKVVQLWIDHGVRTFRVDNPHTKWSLGVADRRCCSG